MKRRIEVSQLQELTDEQKQKLQDWWFTELGDYMTDFSTEDDGRHFVGICKYIKPQSENETVGYPLLDIAQMIDLLELSKPTLHIDKHLPTGIEKKTMYEVFQQGAGTHWGETLCDALWEAVKKIL
jgi:hypothetical protein